MADSGERRPAGTARRRRAFALLAAAVCLSVVLWWILVMAGLFFDWGPVGLLLEPSVVEAPGPAGVFPAGNSVIEVGKP